MEISGGIMSLLEEQLEELKFKQAKVHVLKKILTDLTESYNQSLAITAEKEIFLELSSHINFLINGIENGTESTTSPQSGTFSEEEIEVLKDLVVRAQGKIAAAPARTQNTRGAFADESEVEDTPVPAKRQNPQANVKRAATQDKIQFALANRHLDNRRVVVSKNGRDVSGVVVGLDAPHIIVKTDVGHTLPVLLDDVTLE